MTSHDSELRRRALDDSIGNLRLEGLALHPDDLADMERYVRGEVDIDDLVTIINARSDALKSAKSS